MPPFGDPCGLSWGSAALRGPQPGEPGRLLVSVRPVRRFDALRVFILRTSSRPEGRGSAPRALSCPFRDMSLQPRTATSLHQLLRADGRPVSRCSLSWVFVPYDTVPDRQTRLNKATDPSDAACRVRGLGTPFATSTTSPPGARSAGASLGLTLQGVLLVREWCPFRGPCPPDLADRTPTPRGERTEWLPSGPHSRDEFVLSPASRRRPAVDTFLGFPSPEPSPHPPGRSLVVTMPALASLGGMTSPPTWTTGLHGSNGSAWPVSGLPALMRFHTLRPS